MREASGYVREICEEICFDRIKEVASQKQILENNGGPTSPKEVTTQMKRAKQATHPSASSHQSEKKKSKRNSRVNEVSPRLTEAEFKTISFNCRFLSRFSKYERE